MSSSKRTDQTVPGTGILSFRFNPPTPPPPPYEKQGGEDVYATIGRICVIISTYLCTFAHVNSFPYRWKKYDFQKGGGREKYNFRFTVKC